MEEDFQERGLMAAVWQLLGKKEEIENFVRTKYLTKFPDLEDKFSIHFCKTANGVTID